MNLSEVTYPKDTKTASRTSSSRKPAGSSQAKPHAGANRQS
jgi:hypothetical protein